MAKDKLNPLRTKFDIEIEVDGIVYKIVFKPVNKVIQEKLNLSKDQTRSQYEDVDNKRAELKEIKDLKAVNDEILKTHGETGGISTEQKTSILLENKDYVLRISLLEKEIKKIDNEVLDVNSAIENYYKEMFEECVSGEDRVKLQKTIEDNGISYSVIIVYINEALRESQEKK